MAWEDDDNKKEIGAKDRIWVSTTEDWEIDYFIKAYLEENKFEVSEKNKEIIQTAIESYPGNAPIKRDDLINYLNSKYKK